VPFLCDGLPVAPILALPAIDVNVAIPRGGAGRRTGSQENREYTGGMASPGSGRSDTTGGVVLYASKYGSTRACAEAIAGALGVAALDVAAAEQAERALAGAAWAVLGSPIYGPAVLPAMERFCGSAHAALAVRELAAFVVCGDTVWMPRAGEGGDHNLGKLTRLLPQAPFATAVLGGRMVIAELDEQDRESILAFYRRLGRSPDGFDRRDPAAVAAFSDRVRTALRGGT
jgi:menaquinone-dependent protoporphyrinogen IX oxidase